MGEGFEELEQLRLIHIEGPAKGTRATYFHRHPWMESPEAVPTWATLAQVGELSWLNSARSMGEVGPTSWPKLGHKETSKDDQNKERLLAPDGERDLFGQIGECLGPEEMKEKGGIWRMRIRTGLKERRALRNTIEDFKNRSRDPARGKIRHLAKWFTDKYLRNLVEISEAERAKNESKEPFASADSVRIRIRAGRAGAKISTNRISLPV